MSENVLSRDAQDRLYSPSLPRLLERFAGDYSNVFEFHHFPHALEVGEVAIRHLIRLEELKVQGLPSRFVLQAAALGHDAGMPLYYGVERRPGLGTKSWIQQQFPTPEKFSISITAGHLNAESIDPDTIREVGGYQLPTTAGIEVSSWGSMLLCVSDLWTAEGDYETEFLPESPKLQRERILTKNEDLGEAGYKDFTVRLLSTYLVRNLRGAQPFSEDIDPQEFFEPQIQGLANNITRLATERSEENGESLESYVFRQADAEDLLGKFVPVALHFDTAA